MSDTVQVRMLRSNRIQQDGFHDGYARVGQVVNVSPVVAQDWAYVGIAEYLNPKDAVTNYQPDAELRKANKLAPAVDVMAEIAALKEQLAALTAKK